MKPEAENRKSIEREHQFPRQSKCVMNSCKGNRQGDHFGTVHVMYIIELAASSRIQQLSFTVFVLAVKSSRDVGCVCPGHSVQVSARSWHHPISEPQVVGMGQASL